MRRRLVRCVAALDFLEGSPARYLYTSGRPGRCNPRDVDCLYFSETEDVADLEYRRRFAGIRAATEPRLTFFAQRHRERHQTRPIESAIDAPEVLYRPQQQARADDEHDREPDFGGDEYSPDENDAARWQCGRRSPSTRNQVAGFTVPAPAETELNALLDNWGERIGADGHVPVKHPSLEPDHTLQLQPLQDAIVGNAGRSIWVLQAAVGFLLLIVCANLANLVMAHADSRRREFIVRAALGASRGRLIRQRITEGVLVSGTGGYSVCGSPVRAVRRGTGARSTSTAIPP
jgi:hypothetical protein